MSHVIVHKESWHNTEKSYRTLGMAQGAMKRTKKRNGTPKYPADQYEAMSIEDWRAQDYEVETVNILNPKAGPIKIRRSQKGGCCDPGTERYHCM